MRTLERLELIFRRLSRVAFFPAAFLYYFRTGKENGYPTCCVLHFSVDRMRSKDILSAVERGSIFDGTPYVYVPCRFHKGRHPNWAPWNGALTYHPKQMRLF